MRGPRAAAIRLQRDGGRVAMDAGRCRQMRFADSHVEFDFELLQKARGGAGMFRHDFVGENGVEFDVELAQHGLQLQTGVSAARD